MDLARKRFRCVLRYLINGIQTRDHDALRYTSSPLEGGRLLTSPMCVLRVELVCPPVHLHLVQPVSALKPHRKTSSVVTNYETEIDTLHRQHIKVILAMMACIANRNEHAGKKQRQAGQHTRH